MTAHMKKTDPRYPAFKAKDYEHINYKDGGFVNWIGRRALETCGVQLFYQFEQDDPIQLTPQAETLGTEFILYWMYNSYDSPLPYPRQ